MAKRRVRITGIDGKNADATLVGIVFEIRQTVDIVADEWWEDKHQVPIGTTFAINYCYQKINGCWKHFAFYDKRAPREIQTPYIFEFLPDEEDKIV